MKTLLLAITLTTLLFSTASCSPDKTEDETEDVELSAADFECILDWPKVGLIRINNVLGHQEEAEAVAKSADGGTFPVGTVLQLLPNEAMVKRRAGFSSATSDWEFFFLDVSASGTEILSRGTVEVKNDFDLTCISCHSEAEPQWDLVCATGHGCEPLPVSAEELEAFQNSDPRCASVPAL